MQNSSLFYKERIVSKEAPYKILFTGLDGAGKTSIIAALQREFSKIALIEPTRGAQRRVFSLMGREISEWDLGGQKSYLISYLRNPSKFFDDTEIAIYVIDILDGSRIIESLSYLYDVVDKFKELHIKPPINIFFHKYDPKLIHNVKKDIDNEIIKLTKEIEETLNYEDVYFFSTSIYEPYTIVNAMSKMLLELFPKSELIQKTIVEFGKKLECDGLIFVDRNSIILGSYFQDDVSKKALSNTIAYFLSLNDVFLEMDLDQEEDQIVVKKGGSYFLFKPTILTETEAPIYMLVLKHQNPLDLYFINKDFLTFVDVFKDILKN